MLIDQTEPIFITDVERSKHFLEKDPSLKSDVAFSIFPCDGKTDHSIVAFGDELLNIDTFVDISSQYIRTLLKLMVEAKVMDLAPEQQQRIPFYSPPANND